MHERWPLLSRESFAEALISRRNKVLWSFEGSKETIENVAGTHYSPLKTVQTKMGERSQKTIEYGRS